MEVDHLIPKSLTGDELAQALVDHGLPPTFDLHAEENLAPACCDCNGDKHMRKPPSTPLISLILAQAADLADQVRKTAKATAGCAKIEKLFAQVRSADLRDEEVHAAASQELEELGVLLTATAPAISKLSLTSALAIELDGEGAWTFTGYGDCPNDNCYTGDVQWRTYISDGVDLEAGRCDICGTIAVRCPDCDEVTGGFFDEVPCGSCDNTFDLVRDRDSDELEEVVLTRGAP